MILHPLPAESDLRMISMQIAELTGTSHSNVLVSIDRMLSEIEKESLDCSAVESEYANLVIERKEQKSKRSMVRYFDLNEDAALLLVSGYRLKWAN